MATPNEELLNQIERNDPRLTAVEIGYYGCWPPDEDWARLGAAVGSNTHLRALTFYFPGEVALYLQQEGIDSLFQGAASSASIKDLVFGEWDCRKIIRFHLLATLFKKSQLESLRFVKSWLDLQSLHSLVFALAKFDSLKEFTMTKCNIEVGLGPSRESQEVIKALSGHSGLRKVDLSDCDISSIAVEQFAALLRNPDSNIDEIGIGDWDFSDNDAAVLVSGMAGNSLKVFNLNGNVGLSEVGWHSIFGILNNPNCRLERLSLNDNEINDSTVQYLVRLLANNTTLKSLSLRNIRCVTNAGWSGLFEFLCRPDCALESLDISRNKFTAFTSLIDGLTNNRSVKKINLAENEGVSGARWQALFSSVLLHNSSSRLESLNLGCNQIHDAAIKGLTNTLIRNCTLQELILCHCNSQVTDEAWLSFCAVFDSPHTALEKLNLCDNHISDSTLTSYVSSLVSNTKLKVLMFDHSYEWIPSRSLFCNAASIMDTYNSNHTLEHLGQSIQLLPNSIASMLRINRENSAIQAARLKIINTHFSNGFVTEPFMSMDFKLLPYALAWIGRDGRSNETNEYFYFYEFVEYALSCT